MVEWLPIESAPRDKTLVLLSGHRSDISSFTDVSGPWIGHYYSTAGGPVGPIYWFQVPRDGMIAPTHWMPLPDPPGAS